LRRRRVTRKVARGVAQKTISIAVGRSATSATEIKLTEWQWSTGHEPVAWVGILHGVEVRRAYNLFVYGHGSRCFDSLRLEGNAMWHGFGSMAT
jgi:hypothetical protein